MEGRHHQRWTDPLYYQKVIIATQDPITGKVVYIHGLACELIFSVDNGIEEDLDDVSTIHVRTGDPRAEARIKFVRFGQTHVQPQWADIHRPEEIENRKALPQ
jgi:hypothetical protein